MQNRITFNIYGNFCYARVWGGGVNFLKFEAGGGISFLKFEGGGGKGKLKLEKYFPDTVWDISIALSPTQLFLKYLPLCKSLSMFYGICMDYKTKQNTITLLTIKICIFFVKNRHISSQKCRLWTFKM